MSLYKRNIPNPPVGVTEFEILKASHKFLRDQDEREPEQSQALTTTNATESDNTSSWNDQLAAKYYASLYREFALCDLKHYKSGNFALRWRTEDEVLSGAGETTCGNTRCEHHVPHSSLPSSSSSSTSGIPLTTLELPFGYVEHGKSKSALVKVVLCGRCLKKLMWKRNKEKETQGVALGGKDGGVLGDENEVGNSGREDEKRYREMSSGKGKRKREEEDSISEDEKQQSVRRSQLREDQNVGERHDHGSLHDPPMNRRQKNDRVEKRRRSSISFEIKK